MDWFNAVDDTYRNQLKEINELNWERFKAHLDAGLAEVRGEMAKLAADLRGDTTTLAGQLRTEMAVMRADLLKWMFIYWTGTVVALGGLIIGMAVFGPR